MESLRRLVSRHCEGGELENGLSCPLVKKRVAIVLANEIAKWADGRVGNSSAKQSEQIVVTAENVYFDQSVVFLQSVQQAIIGSRVDGHSGTPVVTIEDIPDDAKQVFATSVPIDRSFDNEQT